MAGLAGARWEGPANLCSGGCVAATRRDPARLPSEGEPLTAHSKPGPTPKPAAPLPGRGACVGLWNPICGATKGRPGEGGTLWRAMSPASCPGRDVHAAQDRAITKGPGAARVPGSSV